jgi:flagellar M-ring protein FliF
VVDNRGELLARAGRPDTAATTGEEARRTIEQRLDMAVEEILGRTLGPGHVRAEATVEMDFDRVNETQEHFDPDKQIVRHTQTVTDASKSTEPQPGVSVQNNLPNPEPQNGGAAGSSGNHQEENTTYEIDKTVRTMIHDAPSIKKISMAVLVDGITAPEPDGKAVWRELSQAELDRVASLVKSAVGFDAKRGDNVDVVNMRFSSPEDIGDAPPSGSWVQFGKADLIWLITIGIIAIVALFSLGFVVRPMALKLATALLPQPPPEALAAPEGAGAPALLTDGSAAAANQLTAGDAGEKDTMLNVANVEGQIRASSLKTLGHQVETQPEATIMVLRGWLGGKVG